MVEKSELLRVPVFADLPDDQIDWFISQSEEMPAQGGQCLHTSGRSRGFNVRGPGWAIAEPW